MSNHLEIKLVHAIGRSVPNQPSSSFTVKSIDGCISINCRIFGLAKCRSLASSLPLMIKASSNSGIADFHVLHSEPFAEAAKDALAIDREMEAILIDVGARMRVYVVELVVLPVEWVSV